MNTWSPDTLDRKILFELSADSRQSLHQLGKKIHCSPQRVEYRLKELVKRKAILNFITFVDYPKLGYSYYVINMGLKNITGPLKEKKLAKLLADPDIDMIMKGEGNWSVSVGFLAKTPYEARERLCKINSLFEPHLDYSHIFIHVAAYHFPRIFFATLQQTPWENEEWVSGGEKEYALDLGEEKLLGLLSENARMSTVELARKSHLSVPTVQSKMKRLVKEGVIRGFTINLNPNFVNHHFVRVYLKRSYSHAGGKDEMVEFFRQGHQPFRVIMAIGKYDMICDVRVRDDEELRNFLRAMRDRFAKSIVNQDVFRIYDIYRFNYFPSSVKRAATSFSKAN